MPKKKKKNRSERELREGSDYTNHYDLNRSITRVLKEKETNGVELKTKGKVKEYLARRGSHLHLGDGRTLRCSEEKLNKNK